MRQTIREVEINLAYPYFLGLDFYYKVPHFSAFEKTKNLPIPNNTNVTKIEAISLLPKKFASLFKKLIYLRMNIEKASINPIY